eukprot:5316773-Lingulodinium_polyedra.AAC.1
MFLSHRPRVRVHRCLRYLCLLHSGAARALHHPGPGAPLGRRAGGGHEIKMSVVVQTSSAAQI